MARSAASGRSGMVSAKEDSFSSPTEASCVERFGAPSAAKAAELGSKMQAMAIRAVFFTRRARRLDFGGPLKSRDHHLQIETFPSYALIVVDKGKRNRQ